jgi:hypothetical protein
LANGVTVDGTVYLCNGFNAKGEVGLAAASIGLGLDCDAGTFENPGGDALSADRVKINGNVLLHDRFRAKGRVRLTNARIGGLLECMGGSLEKPGDDAVLLTEGAEILGGVRRR